MPIEIPNEVGEEFAAGLRKSSGYDQTQKIITTQGITDEALNRTPPVGLNLRLLSEMPAVRQLAGEFAGRPLNAAIFGIAIAAGVPDFGRFLQNSLNTQWKSLQVIDIDSVILREVDSLCRKLNIPRVITKEADARFPGIEPGSLDLVLLDHLGNCCPPTIDRQIQNQVDRVLQPGGIALVNITTSELLPMSPQRETIPFTKVKEIVGIEGMTALQEEIYDLAQLERKLNIDLDSTLRGHLLEIEHPGSISFVVFGENEVGHGEWFRPFINHLKQWKVYNRFEILEIKSREGNDSHNPPLRCFRHNVVLRKK